MAYAQPSSKKQRVSGERLPSALHNLNDDPAPPGNKIIGFISCPENMRLDTREGLRQLQEAVVHLLDLGSDLISVTCERKSMNMRRILHDLKPLIDSMLISAAQPEGRQGLEIWLHSCTETSISFWSDSFATRYVSKSVDPEGGVPATGFFFDTSAGKIGIFATFWPVVPSGAKKRMLEAYINNTDSDIRTMLVGGSLNCNLLGAENLTYRISTPANFHVNGTLLLFVSLVQMMCEH